MKAQGSRLEKQLCENSKNLSSTMHLFAAIRDAKIKKILIQRIFFIPLHKQREKVVYDQI